MKEDFLHYLWRFKKFDTSNLQTSHKEPISIIHFGSYLQLAGPDFFNAQITIGNQKWAGNVEIHLKASDWYVHHHEQDEAYENVILHVVWEHDSEIFRRNNTEIPVLELRHYVSAETLSNYESLMRPKSWIFCERQLALVDTFVFRNWQERLFFERLERKSKPISDLLLVTNSDWEAVMFCMLAKSFGLNTNGGVFMQIAMAIPFHVIRKESSETENLEALFFGFAGLLNSEKEDLYFLGLKSRFEYLSVKYQLAHNFIEPVHFFKHRPDNFPTIRLSQFASLYVFQRQLFTKIIEASSIQAIYDFFAVGVSDYWKTHYNFDKVSPKKNKFLSKTFIDLIIINTIMPLQFAYAKMHGKDISEKIIGMMEQIPSESNAIIDKFDSFGITSVNAFGSQSLLELKNEYCNVQRCMACAIGMELLKSNPIKV